MKDPLDQRIDTDDPNTSVTITYIYDPSSSSVSTKMQILNSVFARDKPGGVREASVHQDGRDIDTHKKYRFIEFFIPGIIAMAVMTASLFGTVSLNTELRQKGVIRKLSATPITRTDWILSNIRTSSYSRSYPRLRCCWWAMPCLMLACR